MAFSAASRNDQPVVSVYAVPEGVKLGDYVNRSGGAPNYRYDTAAEYARDAHADSPVTAWAPPAPPNVQGNTHPRMFYPQADEPPERFWNGPHGPDMDAVRRERAVETVDGDGWEMVRGDMGRKRSAPDPRRTPPPENRPTQRMAPGPVYSYTRPFDHTVPDRLNGRHFSMADHRRTYEIYGMAPVRTHRNTFRAEPLPWDENIVDRAPEYYPDDARLTVMDFPSIPSRWRLQ